MTFSVMQFGNIKTNAEENETDISVEAKESESEDNDIFPQNISVGDTIKFGRYEQDGNIANGKELIEWEVLSVENDKALLISKYALDCKAFNDSFVYDEEALLTWETSDLRKWLNNEFINIAFNNTEKNSIIAVTLENKDNPYTLMPGGNNTNDKIFCLSIDEMMKYYSSFNWYDDDTMWGFNQKLICAPTQHAINNGAYFITITEEYYNGVLKGWGYTPEVIGQRSCDRWFRSVYEENIGCIVDCDGAAGWSYYGDVTVRRAIRPAMFVDYKNIPTSISLDKTEAIMSFGNELTLKATLKPDNVTEKEIKWYVSDPSIASINNGKVTAKKKVGTVRVTAETVNGLKAFCNITVICENDPGNPFADIESDTWKYSAALFVFQRSYMTGKGSLGGKVLFSPDANISRAEFVQVLYSVQGKPVVGYKDRFSDVPNNKWFTKAVMWATEKGIVAGNPDGTFGVNDNATREQMAVMFYKYAVFKDYDTSIDENGKTLNDFGDADKVSAWAENAVEWAVSRGVISGKGSGETGYKIDPQGKATRAETAAMLRTLVTIYVLQ